MPHRFARSLCLLLVAALLATFLPPAPAGAQNVRDLGRSLQGSEIQVAPSCGGGCGASCGGGGLLDGILGFLRNLLGGLVDFVRNAIGSISGGDNGGGCTGGGATGGTSAPPVTPPTSTTPDSPPPPATPVTPVGDGDVPQGRSALVAAIKAKFGVTMAGNWSDASLRAVYKTLAVLPESFRKWNRYMERGGNRGWMAGLGQIGGQGKIWIYQSAFNSKQNYTGIGTIVHEMTHNFQGNGAVCSKWRSAIRGSSVTSYGNKNYKEDMAESVKYYYLYPDRMKQTHASRYNFIKQHIMEGREFTGNEWR